MQYLRPMRVRESYRLPIEEEIQRLLNLLIYEPLLAILRAKYPELQNSTSALAAAIRRGSVWYQDGKLKGSFNSKISKEILKLGGKYNIRSRTWSLPAEALPVELKFAQAAAEADAKALQRDMISALDNMDVTQIDHESTLTGQYASVLGEMNHDLISTMPAAQAISILPKFTLDQRLIIAKEWGTNLDLDIKDWAQENILKLRQEIQQPIIGGVRAESFHSLLQKNYGVSKRKAEFLARQETSLLMSKFQETRYTGAGITKYTWSGANDARERPDHRELNGKIFSWSDPPVTNKRTGARNNPGEDFGCRCVARPILE